MVKKEEKKILKRPFYSAANSMILIAIITLISFIFIFTNLIHWIQFLFVLVIALNFFIFTGFYYLGEKYKNKKFSKIVIIGFILFISGLIISSSFSGIYSEKLDNFNESLSNKQSNLEGLLEQNVSEEIIISFEKEITDFMLKNFLKLFWPIILGYLIFAIYFTIFSLELKKLKKLKYVKPISTLNIIYSWIWITLLGSFLAIPIGIASYILTIRMFLDESKKAKE